MARPPLDPDTIGGRLEILTRERRVTLAELGATLAISPSLLSLYIHGRHTPGGEILVKISEYFGVSVDWILCRTDVRCPMPPAGRYIAQRSSLDLALRGELPEGDVEAFLITPDVCMVTESELAMLRMDPDDRAKAAKRKPRKKP